MLIVLVGHKVQSGFGCVMDQNICLSGCPYNGHFGFLKSNFVLFVRQ